MAIIRPQAPVLSVSGSIGGAVFQSVERNGTVRARSNRRHKGGGLPAAALARSKQVHDAWVGMSTAERAAWSTMLADWNDQSYLYGSVYLNPWQYFVYVNTTRLRTGFAVSTDATKWGPGYVLFKEWTAWPGYDEQKVYVAVDSVRYVYGDGPFHAVLRMSKPTTLPATHRDRRWRDLGVWDPLAGPDGGVWYPQVFDSPWPINERSCFYIEMRAAGQYGAAWKRVRWRAQGSPPGYARVGYVLGGVGFPDTVYYTVAEDRVMQVVSDGFYGPYVEYQRTLGEGGLQTCLNLYHSIETFGDSTPFGWNSSLDDVSVDGIPAQGPRRAAGLTWGEPILITV